MKAYRIQRIAAALAPAICLAGAGAAGADVVWSDDFSGQTSGAAPSTDYTSNGVADWTVSNDDFFGPSTTAIGAGLPGASGPYLFQNDDGFADTAAQVEMQQFADFTVSAGSATPFLKVSFDYNVPSLAKVNQFGSRMEVRKEGFPYFGLGFVARDASQGLPPDIDGDGGVDLHFAYVTHPSNTQVETPIGFENGAWWHDFGNFDWGTATPSASNPSQTASTTPENNNTGGWVHVELLFSALDDTVTGTLTLGDDQTVFTAALPSSAAFGSTEDDGNSNNDLLRFRTGDGIFVEAAFDNIVVEALPVPEPSSLLALGVLGLAALGRRRSAP